MKKIYLSLAMASFVAGGTFAQVGGTQAFGKARPSVEQGVKPIINTPAASSKAVIWTETFNIGATGPASTAGPSFVTPNGTWTSAGSNGNVWKHSFYTTSGEWSTGTPAFTPSTLSDGFMLFDSDSVNYITSPSYSPLVGELISPSIPMTGFSTAIVEIETDFRYCCESTLDIGVQVSTDGGTTWSATYPFGVGTPTNTAYSAHSGGYAAAANVSAEIGGASSMMLKFVWNGGSNNSHYYWAFDDINVVEAEPNDIIASQPYWGSLGLEYYQIPTSQVQAIDFEGIAFNNGNNNQTNVALDVDINSGASTASSTPITMTPGQSDTLSTSFTPAATVGSYDFAWGIYQDETDITPANNDFSPFTVAITDYIYARDNGTIDGGFDNQDVGYVLGNFFDVVTAGNAYSSDIYIASATQIGSEVVARIYELDPNATSLASGLIFIDESLPHTVTSSDLNQWINLDYAYNGQAGAPLTAGATYLVSVVNDAGDAVIGTAGDTYAQTCFLYDVADDTWYYTTNTPAVRMNMDPTSNTVSLEENNQIVGVSIYPNPVSEELTVNYAVASASDVTVEVVDITGKVIATVNEGAKAQGSHTAAINTAALATGVYYANIYANGTKVTKKFVKK